VNQGKVNATLPKTLKPEDVTLEQALELIAAKGSGAAERRSPPGKKAAKKAPARKAAAKKARARKVAREGREEKGGDYRLRKDKPMARPRPRPRTSIQAPAAVYCRGSCRRARRCSRRWPTSRPRRQARPGQTFRHPRRHAHAVQGAAAADGGDGLIARRRKSIRRTATLPAVTVLDIPIDADPDESLRLPGQLERGEGEAPRVEMMQPRAARVVPGPGDRILARIEAGDGPCRTTRPGR
jgi:hypothetical protein